MTVIEAVRLGARRINGLKRMWIAFYAANLLFALVFVAPVFAWLYGALGHSVYADQLLENANVDFFSEFSLQTFDSPFAALGPLAIILIAGYQLFSAFLTGGALTLVTGEPRPFTRAEFYGGCGRWFGRLFAIGAFSLLFYGLVLALNGVLGTAITAVFKNGMEERPVAILGWVKTLFVLALFALVNLVFDFAKLHAVLGRRRPIRSAIRFVWSHFRLAAGVYVLDALFALLFLLAYHILSEGLPQYSMAVIVIVFLLRQAYMVSRIWTRLLCWASEANCIPEPVVLAEPVQPALLAEPEPLPAALEQPVLEEPSLQTPAHEPEPTPLPETQSEL